MKVVIVIVCICGLLALAAVRMRIIGLHYPNVVQNEPLQNPQKVLRIDGTNIFLQNGAILAIDSEDPLELSNKLVQSNFEIDIEGPKEELVAIFARQNGWICGTPWAQPICIPLIKDKVYKNRRARIAIARYESKETNSISRSLSPP
jgi:hypothetical protein